MSSTGPILIIDFQNMVHRARAGFGDGAHSLTYTFFRMLRKDVETFSPSKIYIVKEGRPQKRHDVFDAYKAGRTSPGDDFWRQHSDICNILDKMPVHIVRHPLRECDDTIGHLVRVIHKNDNCVIYSTDTDFIQLLVQDNDRVKLWNPTKKNWVQAHDCDYVNWKSLVGDGTDGIPGFKGIGGKTASKILSTPAKLELFLSEGENRKQFERNQFLISFHEIEDNLEHSEWTPNWEFVKSEFASKEFWSIINDKSWSKFTNTFQNVT